MNDTGLAEYADKLAALGSEPRLGIMRRIIGAHPDGMTVGDIQEKTGIPNSTLSHHLDRLRREGLVRTRRDRQWIWYEADLEALQKLLRYLYADCCGGCVCLDEKSDCET